MTPDNRRDEVLKKPANKTKALETLRKYANKNAKWPRISELKKEFENHKGKMQRVKHNPFTSDRGKIMHAYQKLLNGVASEASLDIIKQEKARKLLLKKRLAVQITLKDNNKNSRNTNETPHKKNKDVATRETHVRQLRDIPQ